MDNVQVQKDLATLLLKHEPEKMKDGSPERREWLKLIFQVQHVIHQMGWNSQPFSDGITGQMTDPA